MNPKHIAAVEIGSSRIKGIVAAVDSEGKIKILAVEESASGGAVRNGRIQNAREVSKIVNEIIRRLENNPKVVPGRISTVFIANGGRSLMSAPSSATLNLPAEEELTRHTLDRLHKEARYNLATEREVLAIAPVRFFVDSAEVKRIVGTYGSSVRGEFTVVTQSPENRRALERITIESHGEEVQRDYVTRLLAQTEMALTDSDRQVGSIFVDFGAETTSVAAFRDGSLLFAATLPIGAANITRDLSGALNVTAEQAENIKHTKGRAVFDRNKYEAPDAPTGEIVNYVSTRAGEIIANVVHILELAGFRPSDFPGGIVIAGGGTRLKGFPEMVESMTKLKTRRAAADTAIATASADISLNDNFDIISLVSYAAAHSDIDCLSFPEETEETVATSAAPAQETPVRKTDFNHGFRHPGRDIDENDPGLLKDDPEIDQPDNINQGDDDLLPPPDDDPRRTRLTLIERLKKIKNIVALPVERIDANDMED